MLLDAVEERIYKLVISYLPKLDKWNRSVYGDGGITIGSVTKYLSDYKQFLQQDMSQNLKVKLIYANVTTKEYVKLISKKEELEGYITLAFKGMKRIEEINSLGEPTVNSYTLSSDSFSEEENQIVRVIVDEILKKLEEFKEVRPSQFPANGLTRKTILKGYIGYDLEKGEVSPAIMQLQRRASLTEEKEDFRTESEYKAKIIAELKKLEN